jgi:hypothetical protein
MNAVDPPKDRDFRKSPEFPGGLTVARRHFGAPAAAAA